MNIKFDSEPVYCDNNKYIKRKMKSYGDKVNTNFQGNKIPKESASCKCLSLIMLDPVIKANKRYYPQTFLEECKYKYKITRNKVENLIVNLIINLIMDLIMMNLMINLLKVETVF